MSEFDFTPILIATAALNIYYPDYVFSTQTEMFDDHETGKVYVSVSNELIGTFQEEIAVPVQGIEDSFEYGDYIRELLIDEGILPLIPRDVNQR